MGSGTFSAGKTRGLVNIERPKWCLTPFSKHAIPDSGAAAAFSVSHPVRADGLNSASVLNTTSKPRKWLVGVAYVSAGQVLNQLMAGGLDQSKLPEHW